MSLAGARTMLRMAPGAALAVCAALAPAVAAAGQWSTMGLTGRYVTRLRATDAILFACTTDGLYCRQIVTPDTTWTYLGFAGERINDLLPLPTEMIACRQLLPGDDISLWRSTDGGAKWNPYQNGYGSSSWPEVLSLVALPGAPQIWIATGSGVEKSIDAGRSWTPAAIQCRVKFVDVAPHPDHALWAGGETCIFSAIMLHSTDLGDNWSIADLTTEGGGDNSCYGIAFHPTDPNLALVGGEGRVFRTTDGGATWDNVTSPNAGLYLLGMVGRSYLPFRVYAGGAGGFPPQDVTIYRSDDAGGSWTPIIHSADAGLGVTSLLVDSQPAADTICVGTANGVYRYVETDVTGIQPPTYGVDQLTSSPNPFASRTTISFTLARPARVRLDVVGVDGRRIASLADRTYGPGPHSIDWDGGGAPSGLYFTLLRVEGRTTGARLVRVE